MPNIQQYTNPVDGLQPSDKGIQAAELAGRRIGSFYHQLGEDIGSSIQTLGQQYQDRQDHEALAEYTAQSSTLDANFHIGLQSYLNTPQDPNNPNGPKNGDKPGAALEYLDQWRQNNDKLVEHATKNASPAVRDRIQEHSETRFAGLQNTALADDATLASVTAARQYDQTVGADAAAAYAGANIDNQLELSKGKVDLFYEPVLKSNYALGSEERDKAQKNANLRIVKGAIDGAADAGTAEGIARARQIMDDPKYDAIIGEDKGAISNEIAAKEEHIQVSIRSQQAAADRDETRQSETKAQTFMDRELLGNPPSDREIALSGMKKGDIDAVYNFRKKVAEPDPIAEEGSFLRAVKIVDAAAKQGTPLTPNQLVDGMGGAGKKGYSEAQYHILVQMNKEIASKSMTPSDRVIRNAALASMKADLHSSGFTHGNVKVDTAGDRAYSTAVETYMPLAMAAKAQGIPEAAIWDRTGRADGSIFKAVPFDPKHFQSGSGTPHPLSGKPVSDADAAAYWRAHK